MKIKLVNIDDVRKGDTIIEDGKEITLSNKDIQSDPFLGTRIRGRNYRENGRQVECVLFPKWFKGEIVGYVTQR